MTSNDTRRNETSERAAELSEALKKVNVENLEFPFLAKKVTLH
jgi:hypothetical protein